MPVYTLPPNIAQFMQRAAASTPRSPQTPDSPSSKRQKLSNPSTSATASADLKAIQAALAAEEAKRSDALERQAAEVGDTKWVLSFMEDDAGRMHGRANGVAHVITTGYSDLDGSIRPQNADGEPWRPQMVGRRSFGKFNRALEVNYSWQLQHIPMAILSKLTSLYDYRNVRMATLTCPPLVTKPPSSQAKKAVEILMMIATTHLVQML